MMRRTMIIAVCSLWLAIPLAGQQPASPDLQQVETWIQQLDANSFDVRGDATQKLIDAGQIAIEPLYQALQGSGLEVTTRGIYVLRELALSGDTTTEDEAIKTLERIAALRVTSAARRAQESLDDLDEVRQTRAVDRLRALGAQIQSMDGGLGLHSVPNYIVTIGPEWTGTMDDLARLEWLKDLQQLTVVGPQVNDQWLELISRLKPILSLVIKRADVSKQGVARLVSLKNLQSLDLMYCEVGDDSIDHLAALTGVRILRIYGTDISPEGSERLKAALAQAEVDYKQGAFLGVRCQQQPFPCEVTQVTDDTAADAAGVEVGDIIIGYRGKPVRDFEDLRVLISENRAGETVPFEVMRGAEPIDVILGKKADVPLGIEEGEPGPLGLSVSKVSADSVVAQAGIRADDVIVSFGEHRVDTLDGLKARYAQLGNGTGEVCRILRGAKVIKMEATLGEWE